MSTKEVKHVCKCENCGNEAEMTFTCTMDELLEAENAAKEADKAKEKKKVKGTGTCVNCGNEAEMWIDV